MAQTLLLDTGSWDLSVDANSNIAIADPDYSLAQDAASAIKTFLGEMFYDTTVGVPWLTQILGQAPSLSLLKQQLVDAALMVPGVASAQVFISSFRNRVVTGQVQVVSAATGQTSAANFSTVNPIGV